MVKSVHDEHFQTQVIAYVHKSQPRSAHLRSNDFKGLRLITKDKKLEYIQPWIFSTKFGRHSPKACATPSYGNQSPNFCQKKSQVEWTPYHYPSFFICTLFLRFLIYIALERHSMFVVIWRFFLFVSFESVTFWKCQKFLFQRRRRLVAHSRGHSRWKYSSWWQWTFFCKIRLMK